jgi:hypothetical protein
MRIAVVGGLLLPAFVACTASEDGQTACIAAGGQCVIGGYRCGNVGPQDCNPDHNPGGAFCCLGCPAGVTPAPDDGGIACIGDTGDVRGSD